jgi:single-strand DNA-binding protein
MGKSVNKVMLLGHVGRDPEIRVTQGGISIATFSLATSERRKVNDEWQDATEWHNVKAFGKTAEIIRDYVQKGSKLFLEGRLQTESWDDKESGAKRYKTVIVINEITLTSRSQESESRGDQRSAPDDSDSIPF